MKKAKTPQLSSGFQKRERKDVKQPCSTECKYIEENKRRGKTSHLFKKIGNMNTTFLPKMGSINDRNMKALKEAEEIKIRWKECKEL